MNSRFLYCKGYSRLLPILKLHLIFKKPGDIKLSSVSWSPRGWSESAQKRDAVLRDEALNLKFCSEECRKKAIALGNTLSSCGCSQDLKHDSREHSFQWRLDREAQRKKENEENSMGKKRTRIVLEPPTNRLKLSLIS